MRICILWNQYYEIGLLKMLLVTGGYDGSAKLDLTEIYDPDIGGWSARAALPSPNRYLSAASIGNTVLIFGIDI